ncbi:MAG: AAA family ATPase [Acidimicrobiales bacterium]
MARHNPFDYGGPVTGDHFTGRSRELAAVTDRLADHIGVAVVAPRRYGKSSLIKQACLQLEASSPAPAVVGVNLLQAGSMADAAAALVRALYRVPGGPWHRLRQVLPGFLGRLRVQPSVTFDPAGSPSFEISPQLSQEDLARTVADVYGILDEIGRKRPAVLVLDEFQASVDLSRHLPRLLKALGDEHRNVSLVLAGSRQHLMESLVLSRGAPLYNMLERITLQPIPREDWIPFLVRRARAGGRAFTDRAAAEAVWELAGPVPFDVQQLAFESFAQAGRAIDVPTVERAVHGLVHHRESEYARAVERLAPGQRRVLKALALGATATTGSSRFATTAGLSDATSVRKALQVLENLELVVRRDGVPAVDDPFLAAWLRRPGEDGG